MIAKHIPDFYILKYLLHDIWRDNGGDFIHRQGASPDMAAACQDAACRYNLICTFWNEAWFFSSKHLE